MSKEELRAQLARDTEAFLRSGGAIEKVPTKRVYPPGMQWAAERGFDYSTWDEIGGDDWYRRDGFEPLDAEDFEEEELHGRGGIRGDYLARGIS